VHNTVFCCGIKINGKFNMVSAPQLLVTILSSGGPTQRYCFEFDLGRRHVFAFFSVFVLACLDRGLVMV